MSAQSKLYEGPALEPLIERIHKELGPDAKIISADRVRQGGVAGFFARQVFRLTVEIKQPVREGVRRPAKAGAATTNGTTATSGTVAGGNGKPARQPAMAGVGAGAVSSSGSNGKSVAGAKRPSNGTPPRQTAVVPETTPADDEVIGQALSAAVLRALQADDAGPIAALADSTTDIIELVSPLPSTETEPFARVLEQVAQAMETASPITGTAPSAPATVATTPAVAVPPVPEVTATAAVVEPVATTFASTEELLAQMAAPPETAGASVDAPPPVPSAVIPVVATTAATAPVATPVPETTATPAPSGPRSLEPSTVRELQRSGLPGSLMESVGAKVAAGTELRMALIEVLRTLPEAPPLPWRTGSLIAVVGDGAQAEALCCQLAQELGIDVGDVAFATPDAQARKHCSASTIARTAGEAAERSPGWRRSGVALVAVDAPVTGRSRSWANNVLMAMRPTAVWGLVDGQCKTEDIKAWSDDLGGMDAVAVSGVQHTVSPAAVLNAGIPVAFVDGARSSAERWASVIAERLPPCE